MPSSFSPSLRLNLQASGENLNLWGEILNDGALALADVAIAGFTTVAITGDHQLTSANGVEDEARSAMLKFTGSLSANATITLPSVSKAYLVYNATNYPLAFTTGAGATVTVDASDKVIVFTDGSAVMTPGYGGLSLKDYISAQVLAATGALPAAAGQAGKYLYSDGTTWYPRQPSTTDLSDYQTQIRGVQVALALAFAN